MARNTYTLSTMVSFLEAALSAAGHAQPRAEDLSPGKLKKRLRVLSRLFERHLLPSRDVGPPLVSTTGDRINPGAFYQGSCAYSPRVLGLAGNVWDVDEVIATSTVPPILGGTRPTELDVALQIDRDGPELFVESAFAYWARRHEESAKQASRNKQPRRRRALDRLLQALMRFAFGFFGSHKVDERNNP